MARVYLHTKCGMQIEFHLESGTKKLLKNTHQPRAIILKFYFYYLA